MKVYVVTKADLFAPEEYVAVKATRKEAEKVIKAEFPNAKGSKDACFPIAYECHPKNGYISFMFIHEENI